MTYKLPMFYYDWVSVCYGLERYGIQIFPATVVFGLIGSEYYVMMKD